MNTNEEEGAKNVIYQTTQTTPSGIQCQVLSLSLSFFWLSGSHILCSVKKKGVCQPKRKLDSSLDSIIAIFIEVLTVYKFTVFILTEKIAFN